VNCRLGIQESLTSWLLRASIAAVLLMPVSAVAGEPVSPCPPIAASAFPALGAPPVVAVWHEKELSRENWSPPSCTGWAAAARSRLLVTLAGQFKFHGTLASLAERIGAISSMREIRYWSADKKAWRPVVNDASALTSPSPLSRRDDFKAGDLNQGARLYYRETDEDDHETVYRLDVLANSADSLVLANENITPIKRFVFTIFKPSTLQSIVILQRLSANTFGVYMLNRTDKRASPLSDGHEETYLNRALAFYRKLIGAKTDLETPPEEWNPRNGSPSGTLLALSAAHSASRQ
jgi:hypothetical protein